MDTSIEINIESDETVSYASYQNSIPLIRSISLKNNSEYPIEEIEVVVKAEPDFLEVIQFNFAKLDVGESRRIADVPLRFRHKYLAELNEAELGRIIVNVRCRGNSAAVVDKPVHVLAYEQWGGTRSIPELLAAFSVPNNPHVERIIAEAAELLGASGRGNFMNAYGSKNREVVWSQVSAIYSAIARRGLQYSMPPASFATNGQKIRLPDRVFETGLGTCLDLTMLIVSCLEQVGLNPVVLVKEGHSWVGCWYINTSFPTSIVDDALSVRKRLENGEMFAFETTGLGHRPVMSLRRAQEVGLNQLIDPNGFKKFLYAIDIRQTRLQQIRPLPSRDAVPLVERQIGDGWTVHPQVGCSGFRVDIGIVDKNAPGVYLIGVECDGATYHGMASARDRDRLRQSILESLNWKITRVWSTDWWTNKKAAAEKLLLAVRNAQSESDKKTTRPL